MDVFAKTSFEDIVMNEEFELDTFLDILLTTANLDSSFSKSSSTGGRPVFREVTKEEYSSDLEEICKKKSKNGLLVWSIFHH